MTTDNTVAEIKAARYAVFGHRTRSPPVSSFPIAVPLFGNLAVFLNRAHDSDAIPETANAVGARAKGTKA